MPRDDGRVRVIHIEADARTIGELRNFGIAHARGELVAHWDDDDWSSRDRISDQVARLQESAKAVTGYSSMLFSDGRVWWRYTGAPHYALGTSLCYRKEWALQNPFMAKQVGEDGDFVRVAHWHRQLVTDPGDRMMIASIHDGNTSPRQLSGDEWKRVE